LEGSVLIYQYCFTSFDISCWQGAIMAAVSSSKWLSFYNDPSPSDDLREEEVTALGKGR